MWQKNLKTWWHMRHGDMITVAASFQKLPFAKVSKIAQIIRRGKLLSSGAREFFSQPSGSLGWSPTSPPSPPSSLLTSEHKWCWWSWRWCWWLIWQWWWLSWRYHRQSTLIMMIIMIILLHDDHEYADAADSDDDHDDDYEDRDDDYEDRDDDDEDLDDDDDHHGCIADLQPASCRPCCLQHIVSSSSYFLWIPFSSSSSLVSCPTRWCLYCYLGFCDDHLSQHPDNRETGYSNVLHHHQTRQTQHQIHHPDDCSWLQMYHVVSIVVFIEILWSSNNILWCMMKGTCIMMYDERNMYYDVLFGLFSGLNRDSIKLK